MYLLLPVKKSRRNFYSCASQPKHVQKNLHEHLDLSEIWARSCLENLLHYHYSHSYVPQKHHAEGQQVQQTARAVPNIFVEKVRSERIKVCVCVRVHIYIYINLFICPSKAAV